MNEIYQYIYLNHERRRPSKPHPKCSRAGGVLRGERFPVARSQDGGRNHADGDTSMYPALSPMNNNMANAPHTPSR